MNKHIYRLITMTFIMMLLIMPIGNMVKADEIQPVVSLGADLTKEQEQQILKLMDIQSEDVHLIRVTIQEEAEYLKGTSAIDKIGNKTMSSAYVRELKAGEGIEVETYNINWVTKEMYENALVTAGVKDAKVIAAAPFNVSGTGALTGILKAFEQIKGVKLDESAKKIANEEMVITGDLGEDIGNKEKAAELIKRVKEEVVEKKIKDPEEIKKIIIEIQHDLNIKLNEDQLKQLTQLMKKINNIDINIDDLKKQVSKIGERAKEITENNQEVKSFLGKIVDLFNQLIQSISNMFK